MTIDNNDAIESFELMNHETGEVAVLPSLKLTGQEDLPELGDKMTTFLGKVKNEMLPIARNLINVEPNEANLKAFKKNAKECNGLATFLQSKTKGSLEPFTNIIENTKSQEKEIRDELKEIAKSCKEKYDEKMKVIVLIKVEEEMDLQCNVAGLEKEYINEVKSHLHKFHFESYLDKRLEDNYDLSNFWLKKDIKSRIATLVKDCENKKLKRQMRWIEFENAIEKANLQPEFAIDKEELKPYIDSDNFTAILQTTINKAMAKQKAVEERIARERKEAEEKIRKEAERKLKEEQDKRKAEEELRRQAEQKVEVVEKVLVEIEQKVEILEKKVEAPIILQKETSKLEKAKIFKFEVSCISYYEANTDSDETYNKIRMHYKNLGFDNVKIKLIETKNI